VNELLLLNGYMYKWLIYAVLISGLIIADSFNQMIKRRIKNRVVSIDILMTGSAFFYCSNDANTFIQMSFFEKRFKKNVTFNIGLCKPYK
jgi:uncharacterized membrane protein YraQ (UPF0718 family)